MGKKILYLDHAATSWPKPPEVIRAVTQYMREAGGNPGRSSHRLSALAADMLYTCRELAGELFDAAPERVVFTAGATHGLNIAINGFLYPGDHVLIDSMAHNAVYRPVYRLAASGVVSFDIFDTGETEAEYLASLEASLRPETRMVICTHASNICGRIAPLEAAGRFCRDHGLLLVVDGAQSAGHIPLSIRHHHITALSVPGHKGLLGPQGCGMLIFGDDAPVCMPLAVGGSGSHSLDPEMPLDLPEHLEAGTLPMPAIAGLSAGLTLVLRETPEKRGTEYDRLGRYFADECRRIPGLRLFGCTSGSVISFVQEGILPSATAEALDTLGICVRSGYHCAPLAHRTIGSQDTGTVRVSFGYGNTAKDVVRFLEALDSLRRITG
ncbi:MAG: aminotransferase class V-fold PLP-dependent enzyme [Clostridia bacterium]|nr:aminotransferase class V-fold PLP-dependent enzyme [Clostridia bacterium]